MSEKPEALRLADVLDAAAHPFRGCLEALSATELRRQHAEIERLREALTYDWDQLEACRESLREHMVEIKRLREALQGIAEVDLTGCDLTAAGYIAHALIGRAKAALRREPGDG